MSGLVLALAVFVLLASGCVPSDRTFGVLIPAINTIPPLPVSLIDKSGIVKSVAVGDPTGASETEVINPDGRQDALVVTWIGGACDHRVQLTLDDGGGVYTLSGSTERDAGCRLVGVIRTIRIDLSAAVAADSVMFSPLP